MKKQKKEKYKGGIIGAENGPLDFELSEKKFDKSSFALKSVIGSGRFYVAIIGILLLLSLFLCFLFFM